MRLARLAHTLTAIINSDADPRTIAGWSSCAFVSKGALKNWCVTARIPARRYLVFARLLRVVIRSEGGRHRPENLLSVADRRTMRGLLRASGFADESDLPGTIDEFLERQRLICEPDSMMEIRRVLAGGLDNRPVDGHPPVQDELTVAPSQ